MRVGAAKKTSDLDNSQQPQKGLWWLSPMWLLLFFIIPIYALLTQVGGMNSKSLTIRAAVFFDGAYLWLGLALLLSLAAGAWLGGQIKSEDRKPVVAGQWQLALWILGSMSMLAYLIWFKDILFVPRNLLGVFTGAYRVNRAEIGSLPGVTSLTNFIPVYFSLVSYIWLYHPSALPSRLKWLSVALVVMTLFRVFVWSERLALIELMCSVAVPVCLVAYNQSKTLFKRQVILMAPFLGIPVLLMYFGVFEYFRSWQSTTYNGKSDFWSFVAGRVGAYYYTALNNGAGLLATSDWPSYKFEHTLAWLYKAPMGLGLVFRGLIGHKYFANTTFLNAYADPEFNNPSGLFTIAFDMGLPLALIYFFLFGVIAGFLYRGYVAGRLVSVLFYPIFFIAIMEVMRIPYLGESRTFTSIFGGLLAYWLITRRTTNKRSVGALS
jgi:hypothetical protein